jgi:arabinogalactan endo-1,4-beta-galactosidase
MRAAVAATALLAAATAAAASRVAPPRPAFIKGVDASSIGSLDCDGGCPTFRWDAASPPSDAVQQLARGGVNTVRIRLWNDPAPSAAYANLTGVLALARRVTAAGMAVWLDFHYSDTWADPAHQAKPAAWAALGGADLVAAVYNFSFAATAALVAQGTPPYVVQTGNEIDGLGMLVNASGQPCSFGGAIDAHCSDNWPMLGQLVAAGQRAVRAASPTTLLAIQSFRGSHLASPSGVAEITWFFTHLVAAGGGDFDIASFSFYPESAPCPCSVDAWAALNNVTAALPPGTRVAIAETSYPWKDTARPPLPPGQFSYTQAGQAAYVQAALHTMATRVDRGVGVVWWGTELVHGYGLGLTALWDESSVGTEALRTGWL